jgi:AraC-like DNA-binding protein
VPLDAADRYICRAMALTGDPGLGLTMAESPPTGAHVILYHMVLACRSLREGITTFLRVANQLVEHVQYSLIEDGERARFVYRSPVSLGATSRFAADFSLGFAHRVASHFVRSRGERPLCVYFRHARPSYAHRYAELFGCPIHFDAPVCETVFPREFLDWGHYLGNDILKQSIESTVTKVLSPRPDAERISERIRVLLRCTGDFEIANSGSIARRMALSERSLRRKLRSEGVSLMEVVDNVRKEIACEELVRPQACIQTTAERLGFADRTAFHRAFKRWTGETPQSYRMRCVG